MKDEIYQRPIRKEETAMMLGRLLRPLERARRSRQIRYYKTGKTVPFKLEDVERYRSRCAVKAVN